MMSENPFEYLLPVEPAMFAGRTAAANKIIADLTGARGKSYALVGGRRCGKSSFLEYLAHGLIADQASPNGHWIGLPLRFDFKQAEFGSADAFLAHLLGEICVRCDEDEWLPPDDAWPVRVKLGSPQFKTLAERPSLTLNDFERGLQYIFRCLDNVVPDSRLILLLDEMDETVSLSWCEELQNRLRSMIYSGRVRNRVRLVLAGSHRFLDQVNAKASPLLNVLEHHFLTVFDEAGLRTITDRASGLSEQTREVIAGQSGYHPYLAQYLLHHLWTESAGDVSAVTGEQVLQMSRQFCRERVIDLDGWVNGVEETGLLIYDLLTTFDHAATEDDLRSRFGAQGLNIARGLQALCYHGVVRQQDWEQFEIGSDLFRGWFLGERERLLGSTPQPPEIVAVQEPQNSSIKILFLSANPLDTPGLRIDEEFRSIDEAMQKSDYRDRYNLISHGAVRIDDLQDLLLRHRPHIVHFSGHGSVTSELILQDTTGNGVIVSPAALSDLFRLLKDNIDCVVLNACYTASQAEAISEHIEVVIGMSDAIGDDVARQFATAFYRALGYQRTYQEAFALGVSQIELSGLPESNRPVLLERRVEG